jgi:hypothetical protein
MVMFKAKFRPLSGQPPAIAEVQRKQQQYQQPNPAPAEQRGGLHAPVDPGARASVRKTA